MTTIYAMWQPGQGYTMRYVRVTIYNGRARVYEGLTNA